MRAKIMEKEKLRAVVIGGGIHGITALITLAQMSIETKREIQIEL